jgi:hypothetical protein
MFGMDGWADHADLWLRPDGRPAVLTSQPYGLSDAGRRSLDLLCENFALTWREEPDASWHFPDATTLLIVERREPWPPRPVHVHHDGLRSTRRGHRDATVFPEAHAASHRQHAPHSYHLRVTPTKVTIVHDYFFLPEDMAERISTLYSTYIRWWLDSAAHRRHFPRGGLGHGFFRDYCSVTVLREHAPWWIRLFREAATLCVDPWAMPLGQERSA